MASRSFPNTPISIAIVSVAILLFSLSVYSRQSTGWSADNFDIDIFQTAMGVPHWLVLNEAKIEGTPPPIDLQHLPEADIYGPGWHLRPLNFFMSLAGCVALAIPMIFASRRLPQPCAGFWPYLVALVPSIVLFAILPTEPWWIGGLLGLIGLPICVMASAVLLRSYLHATIAAFAMVAFGIASSRLADVFRREHLVRGLPEFVDVMFILVAGAIMAVVAIVSTAISRRFADRRSFEPPPIRSGEEITPSESLNPYVPPRSN